MAESQRHFIPAAGRDWLLPLYDPLQRFLLREASVKRELVDQASIEPGARVLDIGCGTGSLTLQLKRSQPGAEVVGLDPDPKALALARGKAQRAELAIELEQGFADEMPFAAASFDRVFSSLMFHHLTREEKLATLRDVRRVLAPGGSLHLLDFGPPRTRMARALARLVHRDEALADNMEGRLPGFMADAGFEDAEEVSYRNTLVGTFSYYRASAPERAAGPARSMSSVSG
jgi:ubiquinone/menaquinone biosynthesis C-methylase UbiE